MGIERGNRRKIKRIKENSVKLVYLLIMRVRRIWEKWKMRQNLRDNGVGGQLPDH